MSEPGGFYENCRNCGEEIRRTNWALGPGWNHVHGDSLCRDRHAIGSLYWEIEAYSGDTE